MTRQEAKDKWLMHVNWEEICKGIDAVYDDLENRICYKCKHFYIGNDDYAHCSEGVNDGTDSTNYQVASMDVVEDDFGCNMWKAKDD